MADPAAMDKLRAVLDYTPEEAARRLPGDPQEYYDALTRRLTRTVAVKTMVRRKVIVARPEAAEDVAPEPQGPVWTPPVAPPEPLWQPEPAAAPEPAVATQPASAWSEGVVEASSSEASSVVEATGQGPAEEPAAAADEDDEFFDIARGEGAASMAPVEPDVTLSESEWRTLEHPTPEEEALAPTPAGEAPPEPAPAPTEDDEAFEEIDLSGTAPPTPAPLPPTAEPLEFEPDEIPDAETALQETQPLAEFEVEEVGEVAAPDEYEVLESDIEVIAEGGEAPYQVNDYTLFRRDTGRGSRTKSTYFFSAETFVEGAEPSPLPEGYEVIVNRDTGVPVVRPSLAQSLPLSEMEGLGPLMTERLQKAGVRSTRELMRIDIRAVHDQTGISERVLGNFRAMAELLQVHGMEPNQAAALVFAGVRTLEDLANATPVETAKRAEVAVRDYQLKLKRKVSAAKVKEWQAKAKELRGG